MPVATSRLSTYYTGVLGVVINQLLITFSEPVASSDGLVEHFGISTACPPGFGWFTIGVVATRGGIGPHAVRIRGALIFRQ